MTQERLLWFSVGLIVGFLLGLSTAHAQACSDLPPVIVPYVTTIQVDSGPIGTWAGVTSPPQSAADAWVLRPHRRRASLRRDEPCRPPPFAMPTPPPPPNGPIPIYTPQLLGGVTIVPVNLDVIHAWPSPGASLREYFPPGDIGDVMGLLERNLQWVNVMFLGELNLMFQLRHVHIWNVAEPPPPPPSPTPGYWAPTDYKPVIDGWEALYASGAVPRRLTILSEGWQNGGGWSGGNPCGGYVQIGTLYGATRLDRLGHGPADQNHYTWGHELAHALGGSHTICLGLDACRPGGEDCVPAVPYTGGRCPPDVYHYSVLSACNCFGSQWPFVIGAGTDHQIELNILALAFNDPAKIACLEHASDVPCSGFSPWVAPHCDVCSCRSVLNAADYLHQGDWDGNGIGDGCE